MNLASVLAQLGEIDPVSCPVADTGNTMVIVEAFDRGDGRSTVVVTFETPPDDASLDESVLLVDGEGVTHLGRSTRRGQFRFDDVARGLVRFHGRVRSALPQTHRLSRRLPAAASSSERVLGATYTSADGMLVTTVAEDDEAHLFLTVTAVGGWAPDRLAQCSWTVVTANGVSPMRRLVTPLLDDPRTGTVAVRYDLGNVGFAEAIEIGAAEYVDIAALDPGVLDETFELPMFASARKAWQAYAALASTPPDVRDTVHAALGG